MCAWTENISNVKYEKKSKPKNLDNLISWSINKLCSIIILLTVNIALIIMV